MSSTVSYLDPGLRAPRLGAVGSSDPGSVRVARLLAGVPLALTGTVQLIFFVQHWLPETHLFPTRTWWLTQLTPLASPTLTSDGVPLVGALPAGDIWDAPAIILLVASIAVFVVCRTDRGVLGPVVVAAPLAVGALTAVFIVVVLVMDGQLGQSKVTVVVLICWLLAAGRGCLSRVIDIAVPVPPKRWRSGLFALATYAVIGPAPTAVGRALFAPELRDAAIELQHNTAGLRLSALITPVTALCYLCGLLAGFLVWLIYLWWPPSRDKLRLSISLILVAATLGALGWPTSALAAARVAVLRSESPVGVANFACGAWRTDGSRPPSAALPAESAAISTVGFSCSRLSTYAGYRQVGTATLPTSLSPVRAATPEGTDIRGPFVAASYPGMVVVAGTSRFMSEADQLFGVSTAGQILWTYTCDDGSGHSRPLSVRFANAVGGDDPARGQVTGRGESAPRVVVRCEHRTRTFHPVSGPNP